METQNENSSQNSDKGNASASTSGLKTPTGAPAEIPGSPRNADNGSEALIEKYNINDQAHSDSSLEDFVKTTSNFHHEDEALENQAPD